MKVSEAKQKVCPFIQPNMERGRFGEPSEAYSINCICGDCMAWEYTIYYEEKEMPTELELSECEHIDKMKNHNWPFDGISSCRELPEEDKEGYCKRLES